MYAPGKGLRVPLTMDLVEFVQVSMQELQEVMTGFMDKPDIDTLVAELVERGWEYETDKYGHCLWTDFATSPENVLRIKIVIDQRGNAKIDFRDWWDRV